MNIAVRISLVASVMGIVAIAGSCKSTIENPDHCVNQTGDAWCGEYFGTEKPFCILDRCVDGEAPERGCVAQQPSDDCWSRCGGVAFADDPTCEGVAESGTMSTTGPSTSDPTMGPSPESSATMTMTMTTADTESESETTPTTTGPIGCDGPGDCGGSTPFCVNDLCVDCGAAEGDASCAGLDANLPLCFDGECVACTEAEPGSCSGTTPICDLSNNTCTGCRFHEECQALEMPACHIAEGSCIAELTEVNASTDGTIQPEIAGIAADTPHAIVLTGGGGNHEIEIDGGQIIAIVTDPGSADPADIFGTPGAPTVTVTGAGTVAYLHRVRVVGNTDDVGIAATMSATLYADNVQSVQNSGGGVSVTGNAEAFLRNCTVGSENNSNAVALTSATLDAVYSTLVGNFGTSFGLSCNPGSTVTIRNSIVVGRSDDFACAGATVSDSATLAEVGPYDEMWFDLDGGDLSLTGSTGDFAGIAVWQTGDPPFDIDGDPRPNTDGAMDYAGADVP